MLSSAHVITSDVTRPTRERLIAELSQKSEQISKKPLAIIEAHNGEQVRERLAELRSNEKALSAMLDLNPEHIEDEQLRPAVRPMHIRALSNAMKHYQALLDVASTFAGSEEDESVKWSLVVEDDAVFNPDKLKEGIERTITSAPSDAEIIFLGFPSRRKPPTTDESTSEFDDVNEVVATQVLPSCESYLISSKAIERIADAYLPIRFPTNIQLTWLIRNKKIRAYSSVPNIFVDGSKLGSFTSSLDPNNQLVWNHAYCVLATHLRGGALSEFKTLWDEQPESFKFHPDALVLYADWQVASKLLKDAENTFAKALETYDANKCIVGNSSDFLKRYLKIFGDL